MAIDLPGHGYSTKLPSIGALNYFDYVFAVHQVINILEWKKFAIVGHSFGGMIAKGLASLYPQNISHLIVIDILSPKWISPRDFTAKISNTLNQVEEIHNKIMKTTRPVYSYDEAFDKLNRNRININRESAKNMLDRHLIKTGKGYSFTLDPRLVSILTTANFDQINELLINISCPYIILIAETSKQLITKSSEILIENLLKKKNFTYKFVDGDHDIHMNKPEIIKDEIIEFLKYSSSKL